MESDQAPATITAVVVTCNRRELLVACLDALAAQTRPVDRIVVLDNASTDGTAELDWSRWPAVEPHRSGRNLGGAGGFAAGLQYATAAPTDHVWLLDDDSICAPDCLATLLAALERPIAGRQPVLAASRVRWRDGRAHPMNLVAPRYVDDPELFHAGVVMGVFPIRACTFVSVCFRAELVARQGLPVAGYFIWGDDIEYTARLLRSELGVAVPASLVEHRTTRAYGTLDAEPGRFFYSVRNQLWTICRSPAYDRPEKLKSLLYLFWCIGAYLRRRWRSASAWSAIMRGLVGGCCTRPREDPWGRPGPIRSDRPSIR